MDAERFDTLTKQLGAPANRRTALGALAAGGFLGALGLLRGIPASGAAEPTSCVFAFVATVQLGPSAQQELAKGGTSPGEVQGELRIAVSETGRLEASSLRLVDGTSAPVAGQVSGNVMQLRIALDQGRALVAVGLGERDISACQGAVDGLVTGPARGDIGDWHAVAQPDPGRTGSARAATPAMAMTTPPTVQPTTAPRFCAVLGEPCVSDDHCCVGSCPAGVCVEPLRPGGSEAVCALPGEACLTTANCCTGPCLGGLCVEQLLPGERGGSCAMPGEACVRDTSCCTLFCRGGVCT